MTTDAQRESGDRGLWEEVLDIARLTPSPHNTQPWKVQIEDDRRATIFLDHRRALPKEDTTGCFILCAMGSFVEAIRLAAANRGRRAEVRWLDGDREGDMERIATIELTPEKGEEGEYEDELFRRRQTSRLAPEPRPLTPDELGALERTASAGTQRLRYISDREQIDRLMELNLQAVVEDLNSRGYHNEIVSWFRYRESTARRLADGLSARCMVIPAIEFAMFAHLPWLARAPVLGGVVRRRYRRRVGPAHQLVALAGPFWDRSPALDAGACLLRLWLEMTRFGLYIHPFGNLVTNLAARRSMEALTGDEDIWIVFRIGRTTAPPRSHRLPLGAITHA